MTLSQPSPASSEVERGLEDELIQLLARQGRRVPIPVFLSALLIASMASGQRAVWGPWVWLSLVTVLLAVRWQVLGRLPVVRRLTSAEKLKIAVLLSAINGVLHGSSVGFAPALDGLERAVQSILLLGLCAGSVATTSGYRPAFVAFVAPTLLPLSAMWAIASSGVEHRWVELSTAGLILVFGLILLALSKDAYRLFKESFDIRQEQADLNRQLRAALEEAETANRAKTRFLASASHDLRQPMHTLSLFSAALTMRPLDEGSRQIARHMSTALNSLGAQLDALLDVSKLDAGIVPVQGRTFSLFEFLKRLERERLPVAQAKGLSFVVQCPVGALCETDELLLERIVRNIVDNAIKYTALGTVIVEVEMEGDSWRLLIRDSGIGIPEAEHGRVFEEFYQIDNPERDRSRGLGLGLSIVRRLTQLLGIPMHMTSAPGQGTEFSLRVQQGHPDSAAQVAQDVHQDVRSLIGLQVLVVDDEEAVRKGMETLLQAHGCHVRLAGSIDEAVTQAKQDRPGLVLADLRLRGDENGITAIRRLRQMCGELPAVLISGDTAPDRLQEAHAAGIRMLHKPVSAEALRQAIEQEIYPGRIHEPRSKRAEM